MYPPETISEHDDLYEIFGIQRSEVYNPFGSHYLNIIAPPLPQPETDPERRRVDAGVFKDHLFFSDE